MGQRSTTRLLAFLPLRASAPFIHACQMDGWVDTYTRQTSRRARQDNKGKECTKRDDAGRKQMTLSGQWDRSTRQDACGTGDGCVGWMG
ncbi:uncharacterized protein IWZ02DRAFT_440764 [Phyllosticta citriasiana]|uniref:uncharacterized protein n=1 Tax=Phyllosticta citriasiana TaxID=595635 RepID=UPI0030FDEE7F